MRFWLAPRSMTLDDLELLYVRNFGELLGFRRQQITAKRMKNRPMLSATALRPTECALQHCSLRWFAVDFFAGAFIKLNALLSRAYLSVCLLGFFVRPTYTNFRDVNETFSLETETFESLFEKRPRLSQIFPETETFNFGFERWDRDLSRPRRLSRCRKRYSLLSFWVQTATNYAVFVSFVHLLRKTQFSISNCSTETFAPFYPNDFQQFK